MGLDVPDLDDRSFADLIESARKRIPVHDDEWTDHNAHDPGIAILEVLAHVAESELYRLDRITDDHRRKYLEIAGAAPRDPEPATARLRLDPSPGRVGTSVPADTELVVETADGAHLHFQTDDPVTLTDATVSAVVSQHDGGRTDHSTANRTEGMSYLGFGEAATTDTALYVGFEGDPFVGGDLQLGIDLDTTGFPEPASHGQEASTFEPSVEVVWEYCTDYAAWYRDRNWSELPTTGDGTDQLYESGIVRLDRPSDWQSGAAILDRRRSLRWLRCRIAVDGHEVPPRIDRIYPNAVTATHERTLSDQPLVTPDGEDSTTARPDQVFGFPHAPVLEVTVEVGGTEWDEVDSLDVAGPDEEVYVRDAEAGAIRFGDEVQGAVPAPDQEVVATSYLHGGGAVGNVSDAAAWTVDREPFTEIDVSCHGADGGRDAESIAEALERLQHDRATPYRAVTADDVRFIATHTPGLRFGRATAVIESVETADGKRVGRAGGDADPLGGSGEYGSGPADRQPEDDDSEHGSGDCPPAKRVRVVVVPFSTRERAEPSPGFLKAVRRHVQRHRLLTDRISVEPPSYVGVGVRAEIEVADGYAASARVEAVETALERFLDPLSGYDGDGWPFGRPIYRSEIYEVVDDVEGVECVGEVSLSPRGERSVDAAGNVLLDDVALAYSTEHDVSIRRSHGGCGGDRR